jgi:hypothetical protein
MTFRKAVVIGINDYPKAPLSACVNDAESVIDLLRTHGDGSPNFDAKIYRDVQTKVELTDLIYNLFVGENEIALLYFSGHGFKDDKMDTFLVTPDAEDYYLGLSVTHLIKMANESKARNRVIILDCCYSGAVGTVNVLGDSASHLEKGVTILTASRHDETARELVNNHGIFTNLLLQALGGGAADVCGNITSGSLYTYIDQALGAHDQRPVFKTNITEFVPLRKMAPQVPLDILRKLTSYFHRPDYQFPLNPSFEETNSDQVDHRVVSPQADPGNVAVFKDLQKYQGVGLVVPVNAPYMYHAAMGSTACKLTPLGMHYWRLAKRHKI